ncbi:MAG: glutamine amidotransferase [Wenzhouxiangellaceae bacterium]|nr:glutamine amidotransferase [Wenzhouxiangellaceae bacterium]MBS3747680.1 glutamine amidotransferase [Wenzhouxiangellaceae bacterium]MBS3824365.1 glutamine amidotransferase [Wenzhouxiangellaceae bacterium]
MNLRELIIVKTGQAVPGARGDGRDFEHWFAEGLGPEAFDYRTVRVDRGEVLPPIESLDHAPAVLVTGSPAMVSDRLDWSETTAGWLAGAHAAGLPILGVCYGHQLLAHALGGKVGPNPEGRRMGRTRVEFSDAQEPLTGAFAPAAAFNVSHVEIVLAPPEGARVIGTAPHDPYHALYFGNKSWGVQFHPEFDHAIMAAYIEARAAPLHAEGQNPAALIEALDENPNGRPLLARFAELAGT